MKTEVALSLKTELITHPYLDGILVLKNLLQFSVKTEIDPKNSNSMFEGFSFRTFSLVNFNRLLISSVVLYGFEI